MFRDLSLWENRDKQSYARIPLHTGYKKRLDALEIFKKNTFRKVGVNS
jgi:hypothetical protein